MGDARARGDDLAVSLAEVRTEVRALNNRFDSFGDLMDAKLAPLQKWMEQQTTVCASHETRIVTLEGRVSDIGPTVRGHDTRLAKVEHVTQNVTWIGASIWAIVAGLLVVLARKVFFGE